MLSLEARIKGGKAASLVVREKCIKKYLESPNYCINCGKIIEVGNQRVSYVKKKKFCNSSCSAMYNNTKKIKKIKIKKVRVYAYTITTKTKKELFSNRKNWQCARSSIQKHARKIFYESSVPKECCVCGYKLHVEVCHKKPVSSFSEDSLITEINNIDNLAGLCPNHHWEFDNGLLQL